MEDLDNLITDINTVLFNCKHFSDCKDKFDKKVTTLNTNIKKRDSKIKKLIETEEYYKKATKLFYDRTITDLEKKMTTMMGEVFFDSDYRCILTLEDVRNTKNLIIEFLDTQRNAQGDADDFGGSLESVAGFIFRFIYILHTNKPRILMLDEAFRDVSDQYVFKLLELMKRLADETQTILLLNTHNDRLTILADKVIRVHEGEYNVETSTV